MYFCHGLIALPHDLICNITKTRLHNFDPSKTRIYRGIRTLFFLFMFKNFFFKFLDVKFSVYLNRRVFEKGYIL